MLFNHAIADHVNWRTGEFLYHCFSRRARFCRRSIVYSHNQNKFPRRRCHEKFRGRYGAQDRTSSCESWLGHEGIDDGRALSWAVTSRRCSGIEPTGHCCTMVGLGLTDHRGQLFGDGKHIFVTNTSSVVANHRSHTAARKLPSEVAASVKAFMVLGAQPKIVKMHAA